jgi:magnesium transporter
MAKKSKKTVNRFDRRSSAAHKADLANYSATAVAEQEEEDDAYLDYFYDSPGSIPGTLIIEADAPHPTIVLIDYDPNKATRTAIAEPEECAPFLDTESVSWIDVSGLGNAEVLERLGKVFSLHPLVLEDVVNVPQRPKVEDYGQQLVLITWMVTPNDQDEDRSFTREQVSFILGPYYLLTVQEEPERDTFGPVRDRIRADKGMIRHQRADYLTYALLDAIVDGFFPVLENYGEQLEDLEEEVFMQPSQHTLAKIHQLRRELFLLRRCIWPQRDAISTLIRCGSPLISAEVGIYLRDCYDHAVQVLDMVETYRDLTASLMDAYLSSVSNRMNEIMKVLTIISTIFIPLTFIVGIYGMNFSTDVSPWNMPELNWYWGYPLCMGSMLAIAGLQFVFFWRRGWFQDSSLLPPPSR